MGEKVSEAHDDGMARSEEEDEEYSSRKDYRGRKCCFRLSSKKTYGSVKEGEKRLTSPYFTGIQNAL